VKKQSCRLLSCGLLTEIQIDQSNMEQTKIKKSSLWAAIRTGFFRDKISCLGEGIPFERRSEKGTYSRYCYSCFKPLGRV